MKKRLRKKKHLKEFQQLGFSVKFRIREYTEESWMQLFDAFYDFTKPLGLEFGGGGQDEVKWTVACRDNKSCTEEHRQLISGWCTSHPMIITFTVGSLIDVWYGPFD